MPGGRRAILSVSDKHGVVDLARGLVSLGYELLATDGTAKALRTAGVPVRGVSEYTGHPEVLGGRVKTLHPKVFAGILAPAGDEPDLARHGVEPVDLVVANLYPFEETIANPRGGPPGAGVEGGGARARGVRVPERLRRRDLQLPGPPERGGLPARPPDRASEGRGPPLWREPVPEGGDVPRCRPVRVRGDRGEAGREGARVQQLRRPGRGPPGGRGLRPSRGGRREAHEPVRRRPRGHARGRVPRRARRGPRVRVRRRRGPEPNRGPRDREGDEGTRARRGDRAGLRGGGARGPEGEEEGGVPRDADPGRVPGGPRPRHGPRPRGRPPPDDGVPRVPARGVEGRHEGPPDRGPAPGHGLRRPGEPLREVELNRPPAR